MQRTCATCAHFHDERECRRFPPQVVVDPHGGSNEFVERAALVHVFPRPAPGAICGEFKSRLVPGRLRALR